MTGISKWAGFLKIGTVSYHCWSSFVILLYLGIFNYFFHNVLRKEKCFVLNTFFYAFLLSPAYRPLALSCPIPSLTCRILAWRGTCPFSPCPPTPKQSFSSHSLSHCSGCDGKGSVRNLVIVVSEWPRDLCSTQILTAFLLLHSTVSAPSAQLSVSAS